MILLVHGGPFFFFFGHLINSRTKIYQTVKGFQFYCVQLYLRDVGSMKEIIFNETECLVQDICVHARGWIMWSKTLMDNARRELEGGRRITNRNLTQLVPR